MRINRHLEWDGCHNARDLGGIHTGDGRMIRWGAVVRSARPDRLTEAGWSALQEHGIRTIIDLRNDDERATLPPSRAGLTTVHVPLDDAADTQFWQHCRTNHLDGSPLYYQPFLERKPERCAAAVAAVAHAAPGGVLVHCGIGRDRTGLVSLLLLAVAGASAEGIVADYEVSNPRLRPFWAERGERDQGPILAEALTRKRTSARAVLLDLLSSLDADAYLLAAGLRDDDLAAVRARMLAPTEPAPASAPPGR